jgi:threonylcarbamoyladenosine tRNA methylthiotransferase MtaB
MCPHFHLSIQSANDEVLKAMKRKYTQKDVLSVFERVHKVIKNPFVGLDLIVGFANETENHFYDTLKVLERTPWTKIHVFPYSERPGTRALGMVQSCSEHEKRQRAKQVRLLSEQRFLEQQKKQIGLIKEALMLKESALTKDYWKVLVPTSLAELRGKEFKIHIQNQSGEYLLGEIIEGGLWN